MAEPKTKPTNQDVLEFLNSVKPEQKRKDSLILIKLYQKITGEKAVMWGTSIVGFGKYHYKSERSSQEGDWPLAGFSPRKKYLTLYVVEGNEDKKDLFDRLGKNKTSKACLYIYKLSDVDIEILTKIIENSYNFAKKN